MMAAIRDAACMVACAALMMAGPILQAFGLIGN